MNQVVHRELIQGSSEGALGKSDGKEKWRKATDFITARQLEPRIKEEESAELPRAIPVEERGIQST